MSLMLRCEDCGREREVTKRTYDSYINYGTNKYCKSCTWNHKGEIGQMVHCKDCGIKRRLQDLRGAEIIDGKHYKDCHSCGQKKKTPNTDVLRRMEENAKRKWFITCKCCGEDREVSQTTHRRYHKYEERQVCNFCRFGKRSEDIIATNDEQRRASLQSFSVTEEEAELIKQYIKHKTWWKQYIRRRDGNRCTKCGSNNKLHSHHIVPVKEDRSKEFDIDNGITLCKECHEDEHNRLMYERAAK